MFPPGTGQVRLQQARPLADRHNDLGMRRPASGLTRSRRHRLAGRLHSHQVRPLTTHRDALSPGGMGRVRATSAFHSRFFSGLRLHLVCTVHGLPVGWALTGAAWQATGGK